MLKEKQYLLQWYSTASISPFSSPLLDQLPEELAEAVESEEYRLVVVSIRTLLEGGVTLPGILGKGVLAWRYGWLVGKGPIKDGGERDKIKMLNSES